jgi:hypothetical protein
MKSADRKSIRPRPGASGLPPVPAAARQAQHPAPAGAPSWVAAVAVVALVGVLGADIFRIGFFADDFHFLDVARRVPLLQALGGRFGIFAGLPRFSALH